MPHVACTGQSFAARVGASVLMGLGMLMLPPPVISLPFKLVFFVVVDGWQLVSVTLVQGFATG